MVFYRIIRIYRAVVALWWKAALKIRRRRRRRSLVAANCGISMLHAMYWGLKRPSHHGWLVFSVCPEAQREYGYYDRDMRKEEEEEKMIRSKVRKVGYVHANLMTTQGSTGSLTASNVAQPIHPSTSFVGCACLSNGKASLEGRRNALAI